MAGGAGGTASGERGKSTVQPRWAVPGTLKTTPSGPQPNEMNAYFVPATS